MFLEWLDFELTDFEVPDFKMLDYRNIIFCGTKFMRY